MLPRAYHLMMASASDTEQIATSSTPGAYALAKSTTISKLLYAMMLALGETKQPRVRPDSHKPSQQHL